MLLCVDDLSSGSEVGFTSEYSQSVSDCMFGGLRDKKNVGTKTVATINDRSIDQSYGQAQETNQSRGLCRIFFTQEDHFSFSVIHQNYLFGGSL